MRPGQISLPDTRSPDLVEACRRHARPRGSWARGEPDRSIPIAPAAINHMPITATPMMRRCKKIIAT
ncbi:MAG: hypothetical protein ACLPID_16425 [Beijerinckiaceae bacterium]